MAFIFVSNNVLPYAMQLVERNILLGTNHTVCITLLLITIKSQTLDMDTYCTVFMYSSK